MFVRVPTSPVTADWIGFVSDAIAFPSVEVDTGWNDEVGARIALRVRASV